MDNEKMISILDLMIAEAFDEYDDEDEDEEDSE